ncbi:PilZ domain-containing protein [Pleionea litopenaei]|uniref:PilZ domain-containing protein n=1 Tax=Pleionea litopenaei TaxID=3070815 RepID=A0AA51X7N0_9GAMM|nr:PilZ domain-containing protein [Pleionea sp. HL-JVS1]WMS88388.1 PilZ domain-containing protein [Pleionea sp. HL-JVS1]
MPERRNAIRTPIKTDVEVTSETLGVVKAQTRELSDFGAFVESQKLQSLAPGTVVTIQAVGFPETMPKLQAEVVRITKEGIGLKFLL